MLRMRKRPKPRLSMCNPRKRRTSKQRQLRKLRKLRKMRIMRNMRMHDLHKLRNLRMRIRSRCALVPFCTITNVCIEPHPRR